MALKFKFNFRERVKAIVMEVLNSNADKFANASTFPDGKITAIAADGKRADISINAADTATPSIPIAPHVVGSLAVGDEVVILRRSPRDMMVIAKKQK